MAQILEVKAGIEGQDVAMTFGAGDVAVCGFAPVAIGLPDFVAFRAGASSGVAVVEACAGEKENCE